MYTPTLLLVTTKVDIAADYVVLKLLNLGANFYRINTEDFPLISSSSIEINNSPTSSTWLWTSATNRTINFQRVKCIWFRRHRLPAMPQDMEDAHADYCLRESDWFIKGSLRLMTNSPNQINWMSYPSSIQKAESKIYQLQIAKSKGFRIPDTLITNDAKKARNFFQQQAGHIIAKPLRLGYFDYGEKQTCVYTSEVELKDIEDDMSIKVAPVIYQEMIPKRYDIRVTIVGTQLFATAIHSQDIPSASIDWRRSDTSDMLHTKHVLPDNIASMCIKYMVALDLNYGAMDLILTPDGEYIFLEINPNGQWAWMEDRLNLPISNSIATWLFAHSR